MGTEFQGAAKCSGTLRYVAGIWTVLLLSLPNDMQLHLFTGDVENVRVFPLDCNFRQRIYRNIRCVAITVLARFVAIVSKENHVVGLNRVVHGGFFAPHFPRNIGFRSSFYLRCFPLPGLRQRSSRDQQRQHQKPALFHWASSAEYMPFPSLPPDRAPQPTGN